MLEKFTAPLVLFDSDPCCGKLILKAAREGELAGRTEWLCPKCGGRWKPVDNLVEGVVWWACVPLIAIF